jgi:hypothetical protein
MSYTPTLVRTRKSGIDLKTVASTLLFTTENAGKKFIPTRANFIVTAASGLTLPATVSIGTNASSYNNILVATALTGLVAAEKVLPTPLTTAIDRVAANTGIYANVSIAATGISGTLAVDIEGYYE